MNSTNTDLPPRGFPLFTVAITFATLFAFLGLMVLAYKSPNYLDETKAEPKADPVARLNEVKARNEAVLNGTDSKMPVTKATAELLGKLKSEKDHLPFPTPEPPTAPTPAPKK